MQVHYVIHYIPMKGLDFIFSKLLIFWRRGSGSNRRIKVLQFFAHLLSGYENKALPSERVLQKGWFLYRFSPNWQRNGSVKSRPLCDESPENWAHNFSPWVEAAGTR
jgi:hypothetical protein